MLNIYRSGVCFICDCVSIFVVEYADDKKDPDNYVRISVDIPGLKKKSFSDAASNADISLVLSDRW